MPENGHTGDDDGLADEQDFELLAEHIARLQAETTTPEQALRDFHAWRRRRRWKRVPARHWHIPTRRVHAPSVAYDEPTQHPGEQPR